MRVLVAVLGAGSARRFDGEKLSRPCAGKPLGQWAVDAALATGFDVVFIARRTGAGRDDERCEVLFNDAAEGGIATSLACAVRIARERGYDGLLVALADMPLVDRDLLLRVAAAGRVSGCLYPDGRLGAPAFFPADQFDALAEMGGDNGAARLLARLPGVVGVRCDPHALIDVDGPADLALAAARLLERSGPVSDGTA